jgi:hypothetical protein
MRKTGEAQGDGKREKDEIVPEAVMTPSSGREGPRTTPKVIALK